MRRAVNISPWKTFVKYKVCIKPPLLAVQILVLKQWIRYLASCIPVIMKRRYWIYLSNSCICFIDWKSTQLHFFSLSWLATCSLNTNSSFLQLSTGRDRFKSIKSNVLVCKKLCFNRLLMIKSSENANGHCRYFLFSITTDPILGKLQLYGREMLD